MSNDQAEPSTDPVNAVEPEPYGRIRNGIATDFWLELVPLPHGDIKSLWLRVDKRWRHLDKPSDSIQASVQAAFCNCPDRLAVAVWYYYDSSEIVGLVVRSKS